MLFGGLQKNSLIDYPGKVSCVLFVSGCNFNCPYCHNPDLVRTGHTCELIAEKTVCDFLDSRRDFLDGVVISGGEPTLQEDLLPFCKKLKDKGFPVKLDTNGSRPRVLKRLIDEGLVDYVAMDIKSDPQHYSPLIKENCNWSRLLESIRNIMDSALAYEFRTTCVRPIIDAQIIKNITKIIKGAMLYALQRFHNTKILRPDFFRKIGASYSEEELLRFKAIVEPMVNRCVVR